MLLTDIRKYQENTITPVEKAYLDNIKEVVKAQKNNS